MHNKKLMRTAAGILALVLAAGVPVAASMNSASGSSIRREYVRTALQTKAAHVSRIVAADAQAKEDAKAQAEAKAKAEAEAKAKAEAEAAREAIYATDITQEETYDAEGLTASVPEEEVYTSADTEVYEETYSYDDSWYVDDTQNDWQAYEETYTETYDDTAQAAQRATASGSDLDLLASIIYCEAGGESYEGQVAVGAVVLNRMESGLYPDSMSDVIYQDWQFTPAMTGHLDQVLASGAPDYCYEAAQAALNGENPVGDCLYFHAGGGDGLTIGNQTFY